MTDETNTFEDKGLNEITKKAKELDLIIKLIADSKYRDLVFDNFILKQKVKKNYVTKARIKKVLKRIVEDCDKCESKETIKDNIKCEVHWLGLNKK